MYMDTNHFTPLLLLIVRLGSKYLQCNSMSFLVSYEHAIGFIMIVMTTTKYWIVIPHPVKVLLVYYGCSIPYSVFFLGVTFSWMSNSLLVRGKILWSNLV